MNRNNETWAEYRARMKRQGRIIDAAYWIVGCAMVGVLCVMISALS